MSCNSHNYSLQICYVSINKTEMASTACSSIGARVVILLCPKFRCLCKYYVLLFRSFIRTVSQQMLPSRRRRNSNKISTFGVENGCKVLARG